MSEAHPRNSFRYCPKCGTLGHFNDSHYSFKCSACGFNFFLNAAAAVTALIFNKEGELLMTRRAIEPAKGMLDLPGGFVDQGESAESAVVREVGEELNIVPNHVRFFATFPNKYLFSGVWVDTVDLVFECEVENFDSLRVADDVASVEFKSLHEIDLDEIPFQSVKMLISKLKETK
jgi:NAD+ diphosphatase